MDRYLLLDGPPQTGDILNSDFGGADLRQSHFEDVYFIGVNFGGASLQGAAFVRGYMQGVSFRGTDLAAAVFSGTAADYVDFTGANLSHAEFIGDVVFRYVNISGATLCSPGVGCDLHDDFYEGAYYYSDTPPKGMGVDGVSAATICPPPPGGSYIGADLSAPAGPEGCPTRKDRFTRMPFVPAPD